jgi:hypothetical protein
MLRTIMKQVSLPVVLLARLWPIPAGYYVRLGVAAIWTIQASQSKYLRQVVHMPTASKVIYGN